MESPEAGRAGKHRRYAGCGDHGDLHQSGSLRPVSGNAGR